MIEVRISKSDIGERAFTESLVLARLREAGIPVRGTILFRGIASGTLDRSEDYETGDVIFRWQDT